MGGRKAGIERTLRLLEHAHDPKPLLAAYDGVSIAGDRALIGIGLYGSLDGGNASRFAVHPYLASRDGLTPIPSPLGAVEVTAAFRDPDGDLHACHASCPHLHGVVRWNALEKSWDCPCHGSRFDRFGRLLIGPANDDLTEWAVGASEGARARPYGP